MVFYRYAVLWSFMYRTCCGYHARYTTDYWPVGVCDCAKFGSRYVVVKECEMKTYIQVIWLMFMCTLTLLAAVSILVFIGMPMLCICLAVLSLIFGIMALFVGGCDDLRRTR